MWKKIDIDDPPFSCRLEFSREGAIPALLGTEVTDFQAILDKIEPGQTGAAYKVEYDVPSVLNNNARVDALLLSHAARTKLLAKIQPKSVRDLF